MPWAKLRLMLQLVVLDLRGVVSVVDPPTGEVDVVPHPRLVVHQNGHLAGTVVVHPPIAVSVGRTKMRQRGRAGFGRRKKKEKKRKEGISGKEKKKSVAYAQ